MRVKKNGHTASKTVALLAAVVLLVGVMVGGTVAWLISQTSPVVNTFTYGDIDLKLEETDTNLDTDENANTNTFKMVPGEEITKDPTVTVLKGSEDSWLFVKLDKSENFDDFLEYTMADGWTQLVDADGNEVEGVFYREVGADAVKDADLEFGVIENNTVTVKGTVTKEMLNALDSGETASYPTLTITAYAVQRDADIEAIDTAMEAWQLATAEDTTPDVNG